MEIINRIINKKLPLSELKLQKARAFCSEKMETGELTVLGKLPEILYRDWIDESLDEAVRACDHTHVSPEEWRTALEDCCCSTMDAFLSGSRSRYDVAAPLIWRGALAYLPAVASVGLRVFHTQLKRTHDLKIEILMPLNDREKVSLASYSNIALPDPMVASLTSTADTINMLNDLGVRNEQIVLLCACTVPEGVYRLLKCYPGARIITFAMGGHLNAKAYIVGTEDEGPGLGDAGDKYFRRNSLKNFTKHRSFFNDFQWGRLDYLLNQANGNGNGH